MKIESFKNFCMMLSRTMLHFNKNGITDNSIPIDFEEIISSIFYADFMRAYYYMKNQAFFIEFKINKIDEDQSFLIKCCSEKNKNAYHPDMEIMFDLFEDSKDKYVLNSCISIALSDIYNKKFIPAVKDIIDMDGYFTIYDEKSIEQKFYLMKNEIYSHKEYESIVRNMTHRKNIKIMKYEH